MRLLASLPCLTVLIATVAIALVTSLPETEAKTEKNIESGFKMAERQKPTGSVRKKRWSDVSGCKYEADPNDPTKALERLTLPDGSSDVLVHSCFEGTVFVQEKCLCKIVNTKDLEPEIVLEGETGSGACDYKPYGNNPRKYYEDIPGHGETLRDCAPGTVFSLSDCGCVVAAPPTPPSGVTRKGRCRRRPIDGDAGGYIVKSPGGRNVEIRCPRPMVFNFEACTCIRGANTPNPTTVSTQGTCEKVKVPGSDTSYQIYRPRKGWTTFQCPEETIFNLGHCCCEHDTSTPAPDCKLKRVRGDKTKFKQYILGHGYVIQPCGQGTFFYLSKCGCDY